MVSEIASKDVKVVLNGDGGDELLAGYSKYNKFLINDYFPNLTKPRHKIGQKLSRLVVNKPNKTNKLMRAIVRKVDPLSIVLNFNPFVSLGDRKSLYTEKFHQKIKNINNNEINHFQDLNSKLPLINQLLYLDYKHYFSNDLLTKMDIASMAYGLEARSPLLDHKLIEFTTELPIRYKINGDTNKWLLKKVAEKYISKDIIYRKKQGFSIPIDNWMRKDFAPILDEMIQDNDNILWTLLNRNVIQLWKKQHKDRNYNHGSRLWLTMNLGLWLNNSRYYN